MPKPTLEIVPRDEAAKQREREKQEAAAKERAQKRAEELERTGGPIHPVSVLGCTTSEGLTIRDYFAAHCPRPRDTRDHDELDSKIRYAWADAMVAARKVVDRG